MAAVKKTRGYVVALGYALIIVVLALGFSGCARDETINEVRSYSHRIVTKVGDCNSSKHSLSCWVETDKSQGRFDLTRWPGNYLAVGDQLYWQDLTVDDRIETYRCRNNQCRLSDWKKR